MAYASCSTSVKWYPGAKEKVLTQDDKILYAVARMTLDKSYTTIPLATYKGAGKLRQSSSSAGVRGGNGDYYIGSYTDYAKYVWKMGSGTHWSTPGTNGKWYEKVWKKQGKMFLATAIERYKLK